MVQYITESIEASGALPTQIAQLLFSGLGGSSFGSRHRSSSATAAAASSASSRSSSSAAASASSRPTPPSRWPTGPMEDFLAATTMALPPIMDPFGLGTLPTGSFAGPPSPWNSSPQSSSASPFSFRSAAAASRERSQPAPAAASSPFGSYSGPSFDGLSSRHEDDFFRSFSSLPESPPRQHSSQSRRSARHDGLDFGGILDYDGNFRREMHPYTRMRNLEHERLPRSLSSGNRATRPSSQTNNHTSPFAAAAAGTSRETALEIYDSDDDEEEVVEVIDLVS